MSPHCRGSPGFLLRILLPLLVLISLCNAIKPVWRTPPKNSNRGPTVPLRSQRASESHYNSPSPVKPGPPAYYTLPENFKIPDYKPARPLGPVNPPFFPQQGGFNPNFNSRPFPFYQTGPQGFKANVPNLPQFRGPQSFGPNGAYPSYPNRGNNFPPRNNYPQLQFNQPNQFNNGPVAPQFNFGRPVGAFVPNSEQGYESVTSSQTPGQETTKYESYDTTTTLEPMSPSATPIEDATTPSYGIPEATPSSYEGYKETAVPRKPVIDTTNPYDRPALEKSDYIPHRKVEVQKTGYEEFLETSTTTTTSPSPVAYNQDTQVPQSYSEPITVAPSYGQNFSPSHSQEPEKPSGYSESNTPSPASSPEEPQSPSAIPPGDYTHETEKPVKSQNPYATEDTTFSGPGTVEGKDNYGQPTEPEYSRPGPSPSDVQSPNPVSVPSIYQPEASNNGNENTPSSQPEPSPKEPSYPFVETTVAPDYSESVPIPTKADVYVPPAQNPSDVTPANVDLPDITSIPEETEYSQPPEVHQVQVEPNYAIPATSAPAEPEHEVPSAPDNSYFNVPSPHPSPEVPHFQENTPGTESQTPGPEDSVIVPIQPEQPYVSEPSGPSANPVTPGGNYQPNQEQSPTQAPEEKENERNPTYPSNPIGTPGIVTLKPFNGGRTNPTKNPLSNPWTPSNGGPSVLSNKENPYSPSTPPEQNPNGRPYSPSSNNQATPSIPSNNGNPYTPNNGPRENPEHSQPTNKQPYVPFNNPQGPGTNNVPSGNPYSPTNHNEPSPGGDQTSNNPSNNVPSDNYGPSAPSQPLAPRTPTYFPRPVHQQPYQPPAPNPDSVIHNVKIASPKPCVGLLCNVDKDQVSLYTPEKGGQRGPTLIISNVARGEVERAGYKPPNPPLRTTPPPPEQSNPYEVPNPPPAHSTSPPFVSNPFATTEAPATPQQPSFPGFPSRNVPPLNQPWNPSVPQNPSLPGFPSRNQPSNPTGPSQPSGSFPGFPSQPHEPWSPPSNPRRPEVSSFPGFPSNVPPVGHSQYITPHFPGPESPRTPVFSSFPGFPSSQQPSPRIPENPSQPWNPSAPNVPSSVPISPSRGPGPSQPSGPSQPWNPNPENPPYTEASVPSATSPPGRGFQEFPTRRPTEAEAMFEHPVPNPAPHVPQQVPISAERPITENPNPPTDFMTLPPQVPTRFTLPPPGQPHNFIPPQAFSVPPHEEITPVPPSRVSSEHPDILNPRTQPPFNPRANQPFIPRIPPNAQFPSQHFELMTSPTFQQPEVTRRVTPPSEFERRTPPNNFQVTVEATVPPYNTPGYSVPQNPTQKTVPNRVRGKAHVVCKEDGIEFSITTILPFSGQIFANDRKRIPGCVHQFQGESNPSLFLSYQECGIRNEGDQVEQTQYHMQVVVMFDQIDGSSTIQSFMAQCVHQKIQYNKQQLPKRIEEALEELHLVPAKLEQKAPLPQVEMKIVVDNHHDFGPEVDTVDLGTPLAIQWALVPESDAYGFHVRNCIVKDSISGAEHKMIDEHGCSTDLTIFNHPHYDTYHDKASAHMWAFKVPDHTRLRIQCNVLICSDIPSSTTNVSSCAMIPSPPFCPDLITSPSNSILFDSSGGYVAPKTRRDASDERRRAEKRDADDLLTGSHTMDVRAAICIGDTCKTKPQARHPYCLDTVWAATSTGFSVTSFVLSLSINAIMRYKKRSVV